MESIQKSSQIEKITKPIKQTTIGLSSDQVSDAAREDTDMNPTEIKNVSTESVFQPFYQTESKMISRWVKESCFTGKNNIRKSKGKQIYKNDNTFKGEFYKMYYSIFELPIFGWSYSAFKKYETAETKDGVKSYFIDKVKFKSLRKFLFCFFIKICGFPLYIAYLSIRFIWMMLKAFIRTFYIVLAGVVNTFAYSLTGIASTFLPVNVISEVIPVYGTKIDPKTNSTKSYPYLGQSVIAMFGLTIPYQTMSKDMGDRYGKGEMGVFIFMVMAASAVIITLTGINVVVIGLVFLYFIFKTLFGIRHKALGRDLRQGAQK